MSESVSSGASAARPKTYNLIDLGGSLGIAACVIGMGIFTIACLGYDAAFKLSMIPMLFGAVGLVTTVVGGIRQHTGVEHTSVLAGLFLNIFGLIGGLLEVAMWQDWAIFYRAPGQ